jgi:hypothetical protein
MVLVMTGEASPVQYIPPPNRFAEFPKMVLFVMVSEVSE